MQTTQTPPYLPALPPVDRCWQAITERDGRFDGVFVTAVRTTGIYCRPSCPAKHPKRENVRFLANPAEAERLGFRACKRCKPQEAQRDPQLELVLRAAELLDDPERLAVTLEELGGELGVSPYHLQRTFKSVMGISPRQYGDVKRLERMKSQLREGQDVTTALYDAGYGSSSRLYERAPERLGMTPATYRRGGAGMDITYMIVDSPLGRLLVGTTERGVCLVCLDDNDEPLEARLHQEYPNAAITRQDEGPQCEAVDAILSYLEGRLPHVDLPVDLQATAFQWQVWDALGRIPSGETRTYQQIASEIGNPKAVRAVAQACASNPAALVIPCHRVVRSDGTSGGYRWGVERKETLLTQERRLAAGD